MSVPHRPFSLTITALGIFLLAIWNIWRAWIVAQQSALLQQLGVTVDPRLRLVMAVIWAITFLWLAFGLWQRRPIAGIFLPLAVFLYEIYHLILLLFFAPAPAARQGWLTQVFVLAGTTAWSTWVGLRLARVEVRLGSKQKAAKSASSPSFKFTAVQRGHNGESED